MLPSSSHATDMEHIKPEAKNATLKYRLSCHKNTDDSAIRCCDTSACAWKTQCLQKVCETLRFHIMFRIHMGRYGCTLEIVRSNTCSKSLLFYTDTDLCEENVHGVQKVCTDVKQLERTCKAKSLFNMCSGAVNLKTTKCSR